MKEKAEITEQMLNEAYQRGHEDGFWNGKTTDMSPMDAAVFMAPYRANPAKTSENAIKRNAVLEIAAAYPRFTRDMVSRSAVHNWLMEKAATYGEHAEQPDKDNEDNEDVPYA